MVVLVGVFSISVTVGLYIISNIRKEVEKMAREIHQTGADIHKFMLQTERRLTLLESKAFGDHAHELVDRS